jgi:hypothetical protein
MAMEIITLRNASTALPDLRIPSCIAAWPSPSLMGLASPVSTTATLPQRSAVDSASDGLRVGTQSRAHAIMSVNAPGADYLCAFALGWGANLHVDSLVILVGDRLSGCRLLFVSNALKSEICGCIAFQAARVWL